MVADRLRKSRNENTARRALSLPCFSSGSTQLRLGETQKWASAWPESSRRRPLVVVCRVRKESPGGGSNGSWRGRPVGAQKSQEQKLGARGWSKTGFFLSLCWLAPVWVESQKHLTEKDESGHTFLARELKEEPQVPRKHQGKSREGGRQETNLITSLNKGLGSPLNCGGVYLVQEFQRL